MAKHFLLWALAFLTLSPATFSQSSGNQVHGSRRTFGSTNNWSQLYLSDTSFLVEASVMINQPTDYFVAVFGLSQECVSVEEGSDLMEKRLASFKKRLKELGIAEADIAIDVTAQERIYAYEKVVGNIVEEKLKGFELKRNVMVRYKNEPLLERLMIEASKDGIYDLVKVDYMVEDIQAVYDKLFTEVEALIVKKRQRYVALTGAKLKPTAQIFAENFWSVMPGERYKEYEAFSSDSWDAGYDSSLNRKEARKMTTYYYEGLGIAGFDKVLNMRQLSPSVQFVLAIKVRYELER